MSMPSSRLDVATRPLSRPDFSSSSICSRRSRDSEPWCAFTSSSCTGGVPSASAARFSPSQCSSLSRVASRSASRRAFTKMSVERCSRTSSSSRGCIAGQIERRAGPAARRTRRLGSSITVPSSAMSSTGMTTSISSGLRTPASTTVTGRGRRTPSSPVAVPPRKRAISSSGRWVADRPIRCGDGPPAGAHPVVEALEGDREVAAALGGRQGVDLVDDHGLDAAQRLAGGRREHQVQRLGRGDEDVGRVADEVAPLVGRRVAGADADRRLGVRLAEPLGREADPLERAPQVLLDVDGQRPQRRHVDDPGAVRSLGRRRRRW